MTHALVLLPGLNNTRAVFDGVLRALPARVQAMALDNPPLETVDAIAQALLPQLPGRFWLAGFSFGGYVALALLQRAPDRVQGIAMVCSLPHADPPAAVPRRQAALDAVAQGRYLEMVEGQAAHAFHPDRLRDAALMQARAAMVREYGSARYAAHVRATMARPDRTALLDGSVATLLVSASHDAVVAPEAVARVAAAIPGAQHHVVPGAGHLVPMEQPQALAALLVGWMASTRP
ncbi:MAG: alpha/beta fold hydrolase [Burkholderiaceae bacterium]|nr:alpha/beta fold hydrolase [Rhodoferax sp.]MCB2027327.1 alpha/beta fold hydrolase [Rhodoferax sp.]MCB2040607.1 alpha/beta fold hydrolase [Rhodoferax sp.]MCW5627438.1 alpha/beta fold hydrolase [Rhodoferax sp.]